MVGKRKASCSSVVESVMAMSWLRPGRGGLPQHVGRAPARKKAPSCGKSRGDGGGRGGRLLRSAAELCLLQRAPGRGEVFRVTGFGGQRPCLAVAALLGEDEGE